MVKELEEVNSEIKIGKEGFSINPLLTCWYPLVGKVKEKLLWNKTHSLHRHWLFWYTCHWAKSGMSVVQANVTIIQWHIDVILPYHLIHLVYFSHVELVVNQCIFIVTLVEKTTIHLSKYGSYLLQWEDSHNYTTKFLINILN